MPSPSDRAQVVLPVSGMHCKSCEVLLEQALKEVPGVISAKADSRNGTVRVTGAHDASAAVGAVESCGYRIGAADKRPWIAGDGATCAAVLGGAAIVGIGWLALSAVPNFSAHLAGASGFGGALLVGLAAGFSSCAAMVGGIVLSVGARWAQAHPEAGFAKKSAAHLLFNAGRIGGFALGGAALGMAGAALQPSPAVFAGLTVLAALVMLGLGIQLTGIFPRFSKSALSGEVRAVDSHGGRKLPPGAGAVIAGALTFFLPCGFTLAMQAQAAASGHPFPGALLLTAFALGTVPGLMLAGLAGSAARGKSGKALLGIIGVVTVALAAYNATGALHVLSSYALAPAPQTAGPADPNKPVIELRMTQDSAGYVPNEFAVPGRSRVRWIVTSTNPYTCLSYLVAPSVGVASQLKSGENVIEFDAPSAPGVINFSCGMGMGPGKIVVK